MGGGGSGRGWLAPPPGAAGCGRKPEAGGGRRRRHGGRAGGLLAGQLGECGAPFPPKSAPSHPKPPLPSRGAGQARSGASTGGPGRARGGGRSESPRARCRLQAPEQSGAQLEPALPSRGRGARPERVAGGPARPGQAPGEPRPINPVICGRSQARCQSETPISVICALRRCGVSKCGSGFPLGVA